MSKKSQSRSSKNGRVEKVTLVEGYRERELIYERTHPQVLLRYSGRWIALEGESVIASSTSVKETISAARARGIKTPYVFYVDADETTDLGL